MIYRAIGLMSGSSLDGLDIAFAEFQEQGGDWRYEIVHADCIPYPNHWAEKLKNAVNLPALDYQLLHSAYGHYIGEQVNQFIAHNNLHYQIGLVASHGHTTFHMPSQKMTGQLGDGAAIAAVTQLPVVTDLRAMDIAFGGQGAPIVPIGEKLLLKNHEYFLNLGGIANISHNDGTNYIAFDVCPANRVLNLIVKEIGKEFDDRGQLAESGKVNQELLQQLNGLEYYRQPFPKSLANDFGTELVYPMIKRAGLTVEDSLRTVVEHILDQIGNAVGSIRKKKNGTGGGKLLVTGGGAFNTFLVSRLKETLERLRIELVVPEERLINYKEALIMAFIGILRWRQEYNVLSSVTGARRDSIGGALWIGQEG
jgi:anhydro-N-acetylmuramic acid kinase